jgi:signal transduction histidine kinase
MPAKNISLLWRILLSTSIAITALLAATGLLVQTYAVRVSEVSLEDEVRTNLQASEALWNTRAHELSAISRIISSMSDVRAAFTTGDEATIRDSAQELWSRVSQQDAVFLVLDPGGKVIASLGGKDDKTFVSTLALPLAMARFPKQVSGFLPRDRHLFYVVLTPVYVQSGSGQALINILLAGFEVNNKFAKTLQQSMHGSEFAFLSSGKLVASTLETAEAGAIKSAADSSGALKRVKLQGEDYLALGSTLRDIEGRSIGQLLVLRSFADARRALNDLQRNVGLIWICAIIAGLTSTFILARRIVKPLKQLDAAASEVARHNYEIRLPVESGDELGRLALTFNQMCDSIRNAREELIRHERIATIGRLSSSIVHDLRNPLAAIYAGAEMLMDQDILPSQSKRLASSIYRASRRIQELLNDLANVSRGKGEQQEICKLADVVRSASEIIEPAAESQRVKLSLSISDEIELPLERVRMERVFLNLMNNALEAMRDGGELRVVASAHSGAVWVDIEDTGIGIRPELRSSLFQPFVSAGKKNGLGLGLAFSRQTVLDHGGDLWVDEKSGRGARFCMKLPGMKEENPRTEAPFERAV